MPNTSLNTDEWDWAIFNLSFTSSKVWEQQRKEAGMEMLQNYLFHSTMAVYIILS